MFPLQIEDILAYEKVSTTEVKAINRNYTLV